MNYFYIYFHCASLQYKLMYILNLQINSFEIKNEFDNRNDFVWN